MGGKGEWEGQQEDDVEWEDGVEGAWIRRRRWLERGGKWEEEEEEWEEEGEWGIGRGSRRRRGVEGRSVGGGVGRRRRVGGGAVGGGGGRG